MALVLALMISFGKTAPENPMDRNRADASRMYLLSSTLDMDMDQLANIGNANINAGDSANQAEQEEQQQEEEKQEQNQDTPQQEQQQNQDTQNPDQNISDPNIQNAVAADIPGSLMNLIQKTRAAAVETEVPISRAMIRAMVQAMELPGAIPEFHPMVVSRPH